MPPPPWGVAVDWAAFTQDQCGSVLIGSDPIWHGTEPLCNCKSPNLSTFKVYPIKRHRVQKSFVVVAPLVIVFLWAESLMLCVALGSEWLLYPSWVSVLSLFVLYVQSCMREHQELDCAGCQCRRCLLWGRMRNRVCVSVSCRNWIEAILRIRRGIAYARMRVRAHRSVFLVPKKWKNCREDSCQLLSSLILLLVIQSVHLNVLLRYFQNGWWRFQTATRYSLAVSAGLSVEARVKIRVQNHSSLLLLLSLCFCEQRV